MINQEKKDSIYNYVYTSFGDMPNVLTINADLDSEMFIKVIDDTFKKDDSLTKQKSEYTFIDNNLILSQNTLFSNSDKSIFISFLYYQKENLCTDIVFYYKSTPSILKEVNAILNKIPDTFIVSDNLEKDVNKKVLHVINYNYNTGYYIDYLNIDKVKINDINYLFDREIYLGTKKIISNIRKQTGKLYLLVGNRGNGKNKILNSIVTSTNKFFLYLPINILASTVNNHDFIVFLKNLKNTIIVIEDCEDFFTKSLYMKNAEYTKYILSLVDGLFADSLGISFILTLNTEVSKIDNNLLNMVDDDNMLYVSKISKEKATKLSSDIGYDIEYTSDARLVDIMNGKETKVKRIGY